MFYNLSKQVNVYNLSKQVDVLPSKNQALHKLNYCKSIE